MHLSSVSCGLGTLWDGLEGLSKQRTLGWTDLGRRLLRMRLTSTLHHRKVQTKGGQEPGPASKAMQSYPKQCVSTMQEAILWVQPPPPFEHLNVPRARGVGRVKSQREETRTGSCVPLIAQSTLSRLHWRPTGFKYLKGTRNSEGLSKTQNSQQLQVQVSLCGSRDSTAGQSCFYITTTRRKIRLF